MNLKERRLPLISIIFVAVIGLDQWTKILAQEHLRYVKAKIYLGDTFRLLYAENKGAFLSLGANMSDTARFWIFTVAVLIFLVVGMYYLIKKQNTLYHTVGLSLILSGGVGNLIDRAYAGYVIDFLNMGIGSLRTGVFNIADVAISAGAIMLILEDLLFKKKASTESK